MRLCILDNDILEPEAAARWGSYGRMSEQLLRRNGFAGEVVCSLAREQRYPADLDRFDALLLTGSRADAFGDEPWVQALREQLQLDSVLLTRSEEGMTLFDAQGQISVAAQAREVFDVTGAGDTVIATLAALLAAGMSLRDAMPWANRAGGIVVGKFGTATVSYQELFA